ncbi:DUF2845 domain-containing protein [Alkalilimnicola ehrlichii MLHE-1]|uniref:DUF2845 domain-containing protein n=1 Tax=Alkalilimnicola ehrlichii (strain ATCC BAA-1101 / DSM 17681 / MLHE-1) TaxID=187272 RepID=Q0ABX9_ALKEH|nr:DUF2845 domain-containing protein [Alkalilimnicola ehrlichii]ABI55658.1 conserved hypothetical protein [Alkalilimnicola ehrlichii MLHE-1]
MNTPDRNAMLHTLTLGLIALVLLAVAAPTEASMRCGARLVTTGDRDYDVRSACGEPDHRSMVWSSYLPARGWIAEEEVWYYNLGPQRLMRVLRFRHGRLRQIETAGYGFNPDSPGSCRPRDLRAGMSELELVARCGEPDSLTIRRRAGSSPPRAPWYGGPERIVEEWLYDFGPQHFYRLVILHRGEVERVERGERHGN